MPACFVYVDVRDRKVEVRDPGLLCYRRRKELRGRDFEGIRDGHFGGIGIDILRGFGDREFEGDWG